MLQQLPSTIKVAACRSSEGLAVCVSHQYARLCHVSTAAHWTLQETLKMMFLTCFMIFGEQGCAQRPGDGVAGALNPGRKEDAKLSGQQLVRQRLLSHRVAQPQKVRRDRHVVLLRLPPSLHLPHAGPFVCVSFASSLTPQLNPRESCLATGTDRLTPSQSCMLKSASIYIQGMQPEFVY